MPLALTSPSFAPGAEIPARHTCEGANTSPELRLRGVPAKAKSLALIVADPDVPDPAAPQRTWVHWVLYDLPADTTWLPEGVSPAALPSGTREGLNDWKRLGYGGPCPPIGRHRYFFALYALDVTLGDQGPRSEGERVRAMAGHVVAEAELMGTYQKR